ncbi:MAG: class I SAM-dependent methyltransferase [Verrucomicrobiota bacterium]|nr:class I SAM-dependent methyltransferase [Verrucomicrobiota bacterium]
MPDFYTNYTSTQALRGESEAVQTRVAADNLTYNILPHLPADRSAAILDVPCGYGRYLRALQAHGYTNATGLDLSTEQIAFAREQLHLTNVVVGDGVAYLREHPSSFDAVLMLDVLEHLSTDDSIAWLKAAYLALRAGGVLIIQVPNSLAPFSIHYHSDLSHQRAYSPATMSQSLQLAGIRDFQHYPAFDSPSRMVGLLRMLLIRFFLNPACSLFIKVAYGTSGGGIHTANLLTVVHKASDNHGS